MHPIVSTDLRSISKDTGETHGGTEGRGYWSEAEDGLNAPWATATSTGPSPSVVSEMPDIVTSFFERVRADGYPVPENAYRKTQPWRGFWDGPQAARDGKLLVACPRKLDFGSSTLGGY